MNTQTAPINRVSRTFGSVQITNVFLWVGDAMATMIVMMGLTNHNVQLQNWPPEMSQRSRAQPITRLVRRASLPVNRGSSALKCPKCVTVLTTVLIVQMNRLNAS